MANDWVSNIAVPKVKYMVLDAAGEPVDGVLKAREIKEGVEVICQALTPEGRELVGSVDGINYEPVEARMVIRGGMLADITDDED